MNPFDAAWALLKQWDDTDWTGEQQPPADDWAGVDWSDWQAKRAQFFNQRQAELDYNRAMQEREAWQPPPRLPEHLHDHPGYQGDEHNRGQPGEWDTAHHLPSLYHHNTRLTNAQRFPESAPAPHWQEMARLMR